jgi:hypothetical protein
MISAMTAIPQAPAAKHGAARCSEATHLCLCTRTGRSAKRRRDFLPLISVSWDSVCILAKGWSAPPTGSILVLLLWVYYSGLIFYFGAEFTKTLPIIMGLTEWISSQNGLRSAPSLWSC